MSNPATLRRSKPSAARPGAYPAAPAPSLRGYEARVTALAERIRGTDDVSAIIGMLNQALTETRRLRGPEDALARAQRKVAAAERDIEQMRNELEHVKAMLHQDPLTGTLNRRGIDDAFRQEASRCDRHGGRLCVAIIDLDDFKALNDTLGHQAGDRALVHVARLVTHTLRPTDRVGRFGGEEFLLLLPDTALGETLNVMERIKRELAERPLQEDGASVAIGFSGGVAQRLEREPLDAVIARADSALYQAKRAGKNRTLLAR
ncbi:MAG: GGDEF domain-containing protein [Burkholderiales bacterium]|nr:GGDEF domain-containing protein [Burkholderiales bacterium]